MKYKHIIFIIACIFLSSTDIHAQSSRNILISDILPFYDFEEIREYVFEKGGRKDYCQNFENLPHLYIDNSDIELYFVSYSPNKRPTIEDYSVMYFVTDFNGRTSNFYIHMADNAQVFLNDYLNLLPNERLKNQALTELKQKISVVIDTIRSSGK